MFHDNHSDSELWLIGDGEKKIEIERYVAENNLDESVRFLGLQSNVYGYLHDADMFTLPSNYEGIPMTLIEAMGTGVPIVATVVGGVPDMLDNNNSILVNNYPIDISKGIECYYMNDALRKEHGCRVIEHSYSFSSTKMGAKYNDLYS